jgi:hypothetical protein
VKNLISHQNTGTIPTERRLNFSKTRPVSVTENRFDEMQSKIAEKMLENDTFKSQNLKNPATIVSKFSGDGI